MPPKNKFTRREVVDAALEITRRSGIQALTARSLAQELGSSVKPIFGLFRNMEEVQQEVLLAADRLYQKFLEEDMTSGQYPPYKASGLAYIRFAREEKELFKLLFMRDRTGEQVDRSGKALEPFVSLLGEKLGLSREQALRFHLETWAYVHGIATMAATSYLDWEPEDISSSLTDLYQGLRYRYTGEGERL